VSIADAPIPGLERLTILAFATPDYSGVPVGAFIAIVNPNEVTIGHEIEYNQSQGVGTTGARTDFARVKPSDLTLSFFLDGTGANGVPILVQPLVELFHVVTGYSGKLHRPHYLMVIWGTLVPRRCVLKSASVTYKLFHPSGIPLRALISATFTDTIDDQSRAARDQNESSDLTHRRIFRAGDSLPLLCHEIYGDAGRYLQVAEANNIANFRSIPVGTQLRFPPIAK
jgi:hypothetical protein